MEEKKYEVLAFQYHSAFNEEAMQRYNYTWLMAQTSLWTPALQHFPQFQHPQKKPTAAFFCETEGQACVVSVPKNALVPLCFTELWLLSIHQFNHSASGGYLQSKALILVAELRFTFEVKRKTRRGAFEDIGSFSRRELRSWSNI